VSLQHPQMGLSAAPLFRVLQATFSVDTTAQAKIAMVVGFQT
jgi:hypothetical protein